MLAVEILTGKVPFDGQSDGTVVLHILKGGRPEVPANAQVMGLTSEIWKFLESCWHSNPKKRPTMEKVVRLWERFVEDDAITR